MEQDLIYSSVLEARSLGTGELLSGSGYVAYALLLDMLSTRWPETSQRLHEIQNSKPFSLSPIMVEGDHNPRRISLSEGTTIAIRVTCLDSALMERLIDAVISIPRPATVKIRETPFEIAGLTTTPGTRRGCRVSSFQEVFDTAQPSEEVCLRFTSPTTFRSGGRRNVVFPSPRLVFNSLLSRWNQYCPDDMKLSFDTDPDEVVTPSTYRLATHLMDFGRYQERGFVGLCSYQPTAKAPSDLGVKLSILSQLSYFSGVGAKTTMGMGQCHRARPING